MKFVFIALAIILARWISLYKVYHSLPALELKRRARLKDKRAEALYKVAAMRPEQDVLLGLLGAALSTTLIIWAARTSWWLAAIVILVLEFLLRWPRLFTAGNWAGSLAALTAPADAKLLNFSQPVLSRLARRLPGGALHTGLYERQDLLELLNSQNSQHDNRISETDLRIAFGAISFGDKLVGKVMTPLRKIKFVGADESVGPMLMDDLHKSGHSRFPVTKDSPKSANPQVVGTLYLKDIIGMDTGGKVKDHARKDVFYINEDSNLRQALSAFLKTHHHLLVVVNNFEEIAGVLSIEDVFEQIIGQPINDEFDEYDSLRAVAAKEAAAEKKQDKPIQPEPADQEAETAAGSV